MNSTELITNSTDQITKRSTKCNRQLKLPSHIPIVSTQPVAQTRSSPKTKKKKKPSKVSRI